MMLFSEQKSFNDRLLYGLGPVHLIEMYSSELILNRGPVDTLG